MGILGSCLQQGQVPGLVGLVAAVVVAAVVVVVDYHFRSEKN